MNRLRRSFRLRFLALALLLVGLGALALGLSLFGDLPSPDALLTRASPDTTKIYDRRGKLLYEILDPLSGRRTRVGLAQLPASLTSAVVAVEDANFYAHPGVDAIGVARAIVQFVRAGDIVSGGSTITQQLARQVLLTRTESESRTLTRKLREMLLALRLTAAYPKDQILEMYLNESYFGNLAYGVEAAANTYFGKPARDLDLAESALLAGLIQSPAAYDPYVHPDAARARQRIVLDLMVKHGDLDPAAADLAAAELLHFRAADRRDLIRAPHFVAYVRNLLEQAYGPETVNHGGLRVVTTLDLDLQRQAEEVVARQVKALKDRTRLDNAPAYNLNDAALVALRPSSGEIVALVGSADYFDDSIDGAVDVALSNRQPGSSIKPLTYAAAFAGDYTPATVISDVPTTFQTREGEPYAPQNYDREWHGPISLRSALATSSNMVAVKVLDHIGVDSLVSAARAFGITTFEDSDRFGLALTLGGGEVKLLELTAAYAAFAHAGVRVSPRAILSVDDDHALTTLYPPGADVQATAPEIAYLITSILSDDLARIPAFGEDSVLNLSRPAAAKTGTTTDFRDNWTLGYTPDLAVGVWAGNADNTAMYRVSGISGAGPIWHDFMEAAHRGLPVRAFERPPGVVAQEICEASGLLPTPDCPRVRTEVFVQGTAPTTEDDAYQALAVDAATGLLWADGCRGPRISRVFRLYPPDALDWARRKGLPSAPELDCLGTPVSTSTGDAAAASSSTLPFVMISPAQNSVFETSPQLPAALQQLEISARLNAPLSLREVTLFVDDVAVGRFTSVPYRALWALTPGVHQARAVALTAAGENLTTDTVHFRVLAP